MEIIVRDCNNCPFFQFFTVDICLFAYYNSTRKSSRSEYMILSDETPEWCALKKENITLKLQEFSTIQKSKVNNIKKEIRECNELLETLDDNEVDNEILEQTEKRLESLYLKIEKYYEGNENDIDLFKEAIVDLNEKISELKSNNAELEKLYNNLENLLNNPNGKM